MKNDGQFKVCDHQYKLAFTGVTVVRQSNFLLGNLNLLIFLMSLLVIFKLACWLVGPPAICTFILIEKCMALRMTCLFFFASFRYYWCGWWSGVSASLLKKYQGCIQNQGLEVMFYNLTFLNPCNCYLYFVNIISWYTDTFIAVCFW